MMPFWLMVPVKLGFARVLTAIGDEQAGMKFLNAFYFQLKFHTDVKYGFILGSTS